MTNAVNTDIVIWLTENISEIIPSDIPVVPWHLQLWQA